MKIPFEPNFKKGGGLITAVVQDIHSNEVIMLAYMNEEGCQGPHREATGAPLRTAEAAAPTEDRQAY